MIKQYPIMRPAIAMIELIFAIVVMGIVMLSVPQLLITSASSSMVAIQQESINEASTQLNVILGHYWDENNITGHDITVLNTTNGDGGLNNTIALGQPAPRRTGTPLTSYRLFITEENRQYSASTALAPEAGDQDDIDDFNGFNTHLIQAEAAATSNYIETTTIDLNTTVSYISDTITGGTYSDPDIDNTLVFSLSTTAMPVSQTTNIKHIQVNLTSTSGIDELTKNITLHAFSCNIGSYRLEER